MVFALLLSGFVLGQTAPAADRPPTAVTQLRETAVALYAQALNRNWRAALEQLNAIDEAVMELPAHVAAPDLVQQLRGHVRALHRAVRDHRVPAAANNANWIARLADEMAASYDTAVPTDVRLLTFFGRALEVDALQRRQAHARTDLADLRTVWSRVEPSILQRHDVDAAREFTDALVGLDAAVRHGDLARAARAEVAAANRVAAAYGVRPAQDQ